MGTYDNVLGIGHITLTVADIDAAMAFYRDVFGLEVILSFKATADTPVAPQEYADIMDDWARPAPDMVIFERIGGVNISLVAFSGQSIAGSPAAKLDRLGYTHLAVEVQDVDAFVAHLASLGLTPAGPGYIRDPDGNLIQYEASGVSERIAEMYRDAQASRTD
jgi:glyoxylase I family protein